VNGAPFQNFAAPPQAVPAFTYIQGLNGTLAGLHVGYNYQISNFVAGVEGDFAASGINGSTSRVMADPLGGAGGVATDAVMSRTSISWLGSLRARLGYAFNANMVYVTGGGAWASIRDNYLLSTDAATASIYSTSTAASSSRTASGWALGVGDEFMVTPKLTIRGEYLHYGFNSARTVAIAATPCSGFAAVSACGANVTGKNASVDVLRVGASYKF
jgi:outer membrane immunogenic protein